MSDPFVLTALQFESVSYTDVAVPLAVLLICLLDVYLIGLTKRTASQSAARNDAYSNGS